MTDAEWDKREHDMAAAWARCADKAASLKLAWEALFATLNERGLPFDTAAFRNACDNARVLLANTGVRPGLPAPQANMIDKNNIVDAHSTPSSTPLIPETREHPHVATVRNTRWGVLVYVPRWWAGRTVRVEVIKEANGNMSGGDAGKGEP